MMQNPTEKGTYLVPKCRIPGIFPYLYRKQERGDRDPNRRPSGVSSSCSRKKRNHPITKTRKNMAFFKEFKEFAMKGNVMDMAVGVIIGGAFGKIVSSLVNDILMPPIGALIGNTDFSQLRLDISKVRDVTSGAMHSVEGLVGGSDAAAHAAPLEPIYWNYGAFIQQCVDFIILAFCVFLMVKLMNRLMRKKAQTPPAPPAPSKEELLLTEIRDLLKEQRK